MSHDVYLTFDGDPITGKIPVEVWGMSGTSAAVAAVAAQPYLNAFHDSIRLGRLDQLQEFVSLPGGGSVELRHVFGTTTVYVTLPTGQTQQEEFYGGILIRPFADFDNTAVPAVFKSSGRVPGVKDGRPALPGVEETDETEWLLVQISKSATLTPHDSIKTGAVRIFRAHVPEHGSVIEVAPAGDEKAYLLSSPFTADRGLTNPVISPPMLSEFYYCGKRVTSIPPLPAAPSSIGTTRLCTIQFKAPSFLRADEAQGVVVVAVGRQLWGIDTTQPDPVWLLLDDQTAASLPTDTIINHVGTVVERKQALDGSVTLTCTGSNAAGPCTEFTVWLTVQPNGARTLSGALVVHPRIFRPEKPAQLVSYSYTGARGVAGPFKATHTWDLLDAFGRFEQVVTNYYTWWNGDNTDNGYSVTRSGEPSYLEETFSHALEPVFVPVEITTRFNRVSVGNITGFQTSPLWDQTGPPVPGFVAPTGGFVQGYNIEITQTGGIGGPKTVSHNYGASLIYDFPPRTAITQHITPAPVQSGSFTDVLGDYIARDHHTEALAIRTRYNWNVSWQAQGVRYLASTGSYDFAMHLVDRTDSPRFGWNNVVADFFGQPSLQRSNVLPNSFLGSFDPIVGFLTIPPSGGITEPDYLDYPGDTDYVPTSNIFDLIGGLNPISTAIFNEFGALPDPDPNIDTPYTTGSTHLTVGEPNAPRTPHEAYRRADWLAANPTSFYSNGAYRPQVRYIRTIPFGSGGGSGPPLSASIGRDPPRHDGIRKPFPSGWGGRNRNVVLRDMRTGGYICQMYVEGRYFSPVVYSQVETVIGNDQGSVRLADVLNEWMQLGAGAVPLVNVYVSPTPQTRAFFCALL